MVIMAISIIIVIIIISSPPPVARTPFLKIFELIIKESGDEGSDTLFFITLPSTPLPLPTHTHSRFSLVSSTPLLKSVLLSKPWEGCAGENTTKHQTSSSSSLKWNKPSLLGN